MKRARNVGEQFTKCYAFVQARLHNILNLSRLFCDVFDELRHIHNVHCYRSIYFSVGQGCGYVPQVILSLNRDVNGKQVNLLLTWPVMYVSHMIVPLH